MVFKAYNKIKNSDYEKEKYEQKIVVASLIRKNTGNRKIPNVSLMSLKSSHVLKKRNVWYKICL